MAFPKVVIVLAVAIAYIQMTQGFIPPKVTSNPMSAVYEPGKKDVELACEAEPADDVNYLWIKSNNELNINDPNIRRTPGGTIYISEFSYSDQGYYQCFVNLKNNVGIKAMSEVAVLQMASGPLYTAPERGQEKIETPKAGESLKLTCMTTKVTPMPPTWSWTVYSSRNEGAIGKTVIETTRVKKDDQGNLHFAYVDKAQDELRPGQFYACDLKNTVTTIQQSASYTTISVSGSTTPKKEPKIQFYSDGTVIAIQGETASLRCFFAGNPVPSVNIVRADGLTMDSSRINTRDDGTRLYFKLVELVDETDYRCIGVNELSTSQETIRMVVVKKPVFKSNDAQPQDTNKTEGEDFTFYCQTDAIPPAKVVWMTNGRAISASGSKYLISQDGTQLTVRSLCKSCQTGSDISVIQCNASNQYGYKFGQGYLNVLTKTLITKGKEPKDIMATNITDKVVFVCEATTDPNTPLRYTWLYGDDPLNTGLPYYQVTQVHTSSQLTVDLQQVPDNPNKVSGKYTCEAKNGYSTATAGAQLTVEILTPVPPPKPVSTASVGDFWWIFVIIVALIAIILLIYLIYYCCCHQGEYEAGKIEDKAPYIDVKQDIDDMNFHDYNRPEEVPFKGSQASLSSALKLGSDDGSMEEYGEPDFSKFNEDGSFLNQYDNMDTRHRSQAADSIV